MPEAVIVAAARSPIGRASKGSLVECRPDDLTATIVRAVLAKVPQLDPGAVQDLMLGCGEPAGESGFNLARVVAILAGMPDVPGVTVNRYCSSSLQTIRMAFHAIKAGEGDIFIAAGVETISRFKYGMADTGPHNPLFAQAKKRTAERAKGGVSTWKATPGLPDIYIAMGQAAENIRLVEHVSRVEMDEFAALSQQRAVRSQQNGFFEREIIPITTPGGVIVSKDDGPRPGTTVEILATLKPVFRPDGEVTAGNCCALNEGAAAVVVTGVAAIVALFVTVGLAAMVVGGINVDCVVGVATAVAVVKTGAAAFVTVAATRGVTALLTKGPFTPKPATPVVAATVAGAIADAVAGATTAFAVTGATVTAPVVKIAPPPPPSFVMTGVGGELIDEFTVICGFAINAGGTNCPVGGV